MRCPVPIVHARLEPFSNAFFHRLVGSLDEMHLYEALMTRAIDLGRELAEGPQVAMRLLKRSIYNAAELTFAQALDEIAAKTAVSDHHPDAIEGMTAFREKRAPRFNQSLR
jgi:2-(1,2-epoxy-1,2-dihydrophenyl)acetyl-CoA isomerase